MGAVRFHRLAASVCVCVCLCVCHTSFYIGLSHSSRGVEQACRARLNKALCSVLRISPKMSSDAPAPCLRRSAATSHSSDQAVYNRSADVRRPCIRRHFVAGLGRRSFTQPIGLRHI